MGELACLFRSIIQEEGLARREDVEKVQQRMAIQDEKIADQDRRIEAMRTTLDDLRQEPAEIRKAGVATAAAASAASAPAGGAAARSTSLAGASTAASSAGGAGEWTPRSVLVRGWAPFGAGPASKLNKAEYKVAGDKLLNFLPLALRAQVSVAAPYVLNHQITMYLREASSDLCHRVREALQDGIERASYTIREVTPRCSVELSPRKRTLVRNMFRGIDRLKAAKVQEAQFDICHRSCQILAIPSYRLVGHTPPGSACWAWDPQGCQELGFDPEEAAAADAAEAAS